MRTKEVNEQVSSGFTCEDSKLLEVIMEHILFHWDDIMACLIDELIQEEVVELNKIEDLKRVKNENSLNLADRSMHGKFHDYKSIDLREITKIFDEYH